MKFLFTCQNTFIELDVWLGIALSASVMTMQSANNFMIIEKHSINMTLIL